MEFESNGMLGKVGGEFIAAGSNSFPKADSTSPKMMTAETEVRHLGMVRIHYRLMSSRHHRSVNWYWLACFAEQIGADS